MRDEELKAALQSVAKTARPTPTQIAALIRGLIDGDPTGQMRNEAEVWLRANG